MCKTYSIHISYEITRLLSVFPSFSLRIKAPLSPLRLQLKPEASTYRTSTLDIRSSFEHAFAPEIVHQSSGSLRLHSAWPAARRSRSITYCPRTKIEITLDRHQTSSANHVTSIQTRWIHFTVHEMTKRLDIGVIGQSFPNNFALIFWPRKIHSPCPKSLRWIFDVYRDHTRLRHVWSFESV